MNETRETFLTVPEVAARLRIGRATAYRLVAQGTIPAVRIGFDRGPLRVDAAELERWLYAVQASPAAFPPFRRGADNPERGDPQGAVDSPAHTGAANG